MKKSELRQIIREELTRNLLKEGNLDRSHPQFKSILNIVNSRASKVTGLPIKFKDLDNGKINGKVSTSYPGFKAIFDTFEYEARCSAEEEDGNILMGYIIKFSWNFRRGSNGYMLQEVSHDGGKTWQRWS